VAVTSRKVAAPGVSDWTTTVPVFLTVAPLTVTFLTG
jgi:hypothetical protein